MAGQYFSDPRVFYAVSGNQKLVSLDELFNHGAKKEAKFIEGEIKRTFGGGAGAEVSNKENEKAEKKSEAKSKINTVELNVNLCCDSCVRNVTDALDDLEGVERVDCDQWKKKVSVKGNAKPEVVLKKVRKVKKDAELVQKKQN